MIRKLLLASLICLPAWAGEPIVVNSGDTRTAVVELYTSEGCSSCPPADRWLSKLVEIPKDELDVLALSFHVDYWDYLGWRDRFADPRYSARQRRYAQQRAVRIVYTPAIIVNGQGWRPGLFSKRPTRASERSGTLEVVLEGQLLGGDEV